MAAVNIGHLEPGEESPNDRQCFVWHVLALRTPHKQDWFVEGRLLRVPVWKISHVVQSSRQRPNRHTKLPDTLASWLIEISKQELSDGKILSAVSRRQSTKLSHHTSSYSCKILSASLCFVTPASSILFIPWIYLAKSLCSTASTGALSTETTSAISSGERNASVNAVFAPLPNQP